MDSSSISISQKVEAKKETKKEQGPHTLSLSLSFHLPVCLSLMETPGAKSKTKLPSFPCFAFLPPFSHHASHPFPMKRLSHG